MKTKGTILEFDAIDILPEEDLFWKAQGYTGDGRIPEKVIDCYNDSIDMFKECCDAKALINRCTTEEALLVFHGEGRNDSDNPVEPIITSARNLGIFTATIGNKISANIDRLFDKNEFLTAFMLDSFASMAVDKLVRRCESFLKDIISNTNPESIALSYSPGYCGWNISSQKMLFEFLNPRQIGISVNDKFMMTPIKSTSGILAEGAKEIHLFKPNFDFCSFCRTNSCVIRMRELELN